MEEMKEALKARESEKVSTIRLLLAAIKNKEIEKGKGQPLSEKEVIDLITSSIRQRKESIEQFEKGHRADLVAKEQRELDVLRGFLPPSLSPQELETQLKEVMREVGATGIGDVGKVMKAVMPRVAGRCEGAQVAEMAKALLSGKAITPKQAE